MNLVRRKLEILSQKSQVVQAKGFFFLKKKNTENQIDLRTAAFNHETITKFIFPWLNSLISLSRKEISSDLPLGPGNLIVNPRM